MAKIRSGGVARVCSTAHKLPFYPHLAKHFGYDAVWICAEHRPWDPREIELMLLQCRSADIDCIWRPATLEKSGIARLFEDGATALMIPHVSTPEKAAMLVEHSKFPPLGDRGVDGSNTDAGYLVGKPVTYLEDINRETFLIAQIETPTAVDNVEAIAATPGLEMLLVGPGDLSVRLKCLPSIREEAMRAAVQRVADACKRHGKAWGFPVGNAQDACTVVEMGCQLVVHGNDFMGLHAHLEKCSQELASVLD
jgi:4-hydroxy-2-oxoheptanedioate aldolase